MSMEQRITTLEEVTQLLIAAQRDINATARRLRAAHDLYQEAMVEVADSLDRHEDTLQALFAYLPSTRAEIFRLDHRIGAIEGA